MVRSTNSNSARRSDEIRARRDTHTRKTAPPAAASSKRQPAASLRRRSKSRVFEYEGPPVLVRGIASGASQASPRTRARSARRRYDIPLGVPGAEMSLPALPQIRFGWRLLSAILVATLGYALYYAWTSSTFKAGEPQLSGLQRIPAQEVLAVLDVNAAPVFTLDAGRMEQELAATFPEFSAVNVEIGLPNTVAVTVTERVPVLTWQQGDQLKLVDADGMAFPVRPGGPEAPKPVVQAAAAPPALVPTPAPDLLKSPSLSIPGLAGAEEEAQEIKAEVFLTPEMVKAVLDLAAKTPGDTSLVYTGNHGLGWRDPRGWDVYFGDTGDMETKLHIYQAMVQRLSEEEIVPALVSVEHLDAPYYRLEP